MNSNLRILIITFVYSDNNYGQRLQAYALQQWLISRFSATVKILDERSNESRKSQAISFTEFEDQYMDFLRPTTAIEVKKFNPNVVVFGSDQILSPRFKKRLKDYCFGISETHDNVMSYASSNKGVKITQSTTKTDIDLQKKIIADNIKSLKKFKQISTREYITAESINALGLKACCNIDPVFLLDAEEWRKVAKRPRYISDGEVFDVEYLFKTLPTMKLNDDGTKTYIISTNRHKYLNVSPAEFIWLIDHCRRIKTRSFHGLAFSLIFNKQNIEMVNDNAKNSRINTLTKMLDVDSELKELDYVKLNRNIKICQQAAYTYFMQNYAFSTIANIQQKECNGCMVCRYICPVNAITDIYDKNLVRYPSVDSTKCIKCGKCLDICRKSNNGNDYHLPLKIFTCTSKNVLDKNISASGGFIYVISKYFIQKYDGIVYGVSYDKHCMTAFFSKATTSEELEKFRSSKYIQTEPVPWKQLLEDIKSDKHILFVGLPCQTSVLMNLIDEQDKSKLLIITLICHGVLKPSVQLKFIQQLESKYGSKVIYINTRSNGKYTYVKFENGIDTTITSPRVRIASQLKPSTCRTSCANCQIKFPYITGDFIVGDPHGIYDATKKYNLILCMSDRSTMLFDQICMNLTDIIEQNNNYTLFQMMKYNSTFFKSI